MKILHLVDGIPPAALGGTGRMVMEIARGQSRSGHDVTVLSAAAPGTLPEMIGAVHLLWVPLRSERWAHWRTVFSSSLERSVTEKIRSVRPDIVHAHTISRQIGYRWMPRIRRENMKIIVTIHDVSHVAYGKVLGTEKSLWFRDMHRYRWGWNPLRTLMIRRYLRCSHAMFAVSDALRAYLLRRGLTNIQVLHNGIDLDFWKLDVSKVEARKRLGLPGDRFLFLLAGRMGYDKGSTLVAATLPRNADLILAGDGFSDEFAPVKDRMHLFKNQTAEEMKLQYAAADVVLVPSRCLDCFPTVCLEAMAMERPVIATSWGGAKESVRDGETGWIVDPMDENAWEEKMQWCADHPSELEDIGKAGRRRMLSLFSLDTLLKRLEEAYA